VANSKDYKCFRYWRTRSEEIPDELVALNGCFCNPRHTSRRPLAYGEHRGFLLSPCSEEHSTWGGTITPW
jgi:hypothetical protein